MIRLTMDNNVPYSLTRLGVVMTPEPGNLLEAMGVLNPGSGRTPDGRLHLLPRLVADGNVSRVGLAEVVLSEGVPVSVERQGIVLAPEEDGNAAPTMLESKTSGHLGAKPGYARHDLRGVRPIGSAAGPCGLC